MRSDLRIFKYEGFLHRHSTNYFWGNLYLIDYIDWAVILGKNAFFDSNVGSSFLAVILCLIKPFLASWPMTAVEVSETRRMALSTAWVWQGYLGTWNGESLKAEISAFVFSNVRGRLRALKKPIPTHLLSQFAKKIFNKWLKWV